jgi:hypothetical protein
MDYPVKRKKVRKKPLYYSEYHLGFCAKTSEDIVLFE